MTILAFSYIRFSSEPQKKGDSLRRQTEAAIKYAADHNLTLDTHSYQDLGVSAFKAKNFIEGKLGAFIEAVELGKIPRGSYLLIENFDRFSREDVDIALEMLLRVIRLGIFIVTLTDNQVYSTEHIRDNPFKLMLSIGEMHRAHQESARKSELIKKAWANKIENSREKIITKMAPAWLSVNDKGKWVVDKKKAKLVERIYKMALDGMGGTKIADILYKEKVEPFGNAKDGWVVGTVAHVLTNKAVIGVRSSKRENKEIENYYPPIIDPEVFWSVQRARQERHNAPSSRGNNLVGNMFAGRSFCGVCGAKMKVISQTGGYVYIHCEKSYSKRGCDAPRVAYKTFERVVLANVAYNLNESVYGKFDENQRDNRPGVLAEIVDKEKGINSLVEYMMMNPSSQILSKKLKQLELEKEELEKSLSKALPAIEEVDMKERIEAYQFLYEVYKSFDETPLEELKTICVDDGEGGMTKPGEMFEIYREDRQRIQASLRNIIKKVRFHQLPSKKTKKGEVDYFEVTLVNDEVIEGSYVRQSTGFQRGNVNGKSK